MKASAVIDELQRLIAEHGDEEVFIDMGMGALCEIEEVDKGASDEGFIIWPE